MKVWICDNCNHIIKDENFLKELIKYKCPNCEQSIWQFKSKIINNFNGVNI